MTESTPPQSTGTTLQKILKVHLTRSRQVVVAQNVSNNSPNILTIHMEAIDVYFVHIIINQAQAMCVHMCVGLMNRVTDHDAIKLPLLWSGCKGIETVN